MAPVRGVFFDLYRTLLVADDVQALRRDWLAAVQGTLARRGYEIDVERLGEGFPDLFTRPEPPPADDGLTVLERRLARLCRELGLKVASRDLPALSAAAVAAWGRHFRLDAEALPLLQALYGRAELALISNFDQPAHVRQTLAETGLGRYFATVTISGELGVRKPDPAIFRPALAASRLPPAEVVYVGDSAEDVAGARAAGIRPVRIDRGGRHDGGDGVPTIRRLAELPALLG